MSTVKLYIQQHNKTGLKYFHKSSRKDHRGYIGSGLYWGRHLKKYGKDVTCIWELEVPEEEVQELAIFLSEEMDIVNSPEFANLILENGLQGGSTGPKSEETRAKIRLASSKFRHTPETKEKMSQLKLGIPKSEEHKANMSKGHAKTTFSKRWTEIEVNGVTYKSVTEAIKETGLSKHYVYKMGVKK